jgi:cysteinyl-tRNA synthetase
MSLRFFNTLAGKVEEFSPLTEGQVRMYTCGPTVYDYAHIGNFRTFVFQDILRRHLKYRGYKILHVMNVTDVDDNTIRNAQAAGLPLRDFTTRYIEAFQADRDLLNLESPEVEVRATDHIADMVRVIKILVEKGFAYESDGSYYYRVKNFPGYGKLSKIDFSGIRAGARVDADKYDKDSARDFVLWKAAKSGEPSWETPLGRGRPGWHIECSVMSMKYLGETFDIHSGGSDLIFPHHENEIAQSEAATGKPFVRYWLHAEHLIVNGEKMSKSLGNFYTLRDLLTKGCKPSAIRYLLASVPFRKPLNFTFDGLHQAQQSLARLRNFYYRLTMGKFPVAENARLAERAHAARSEFEASLDDNLNTAEALAAIFNLVRDGNTAMDRGEFREGDRGPFLDTLRRWDQIFAVLEDRDDEKLRGLGFLQEPKTEALQPEQIPNGHPPLHSGTLSDPEIERQIHEREQARRGADYARADQIRQELLEAGVLLEDTKAGTRWKRK